MSVKIIIEPMGLPPQEIEGVLDQGVLITAEEFVPKMVNASYYLLREDGKKYRLEIPTYKARLEKQNIFEYFIKLRIT